MNFCSLKVLTSYLRVKAMYLPGKFAMFPEGLTLIGHFCVSDARTSDFSKLNHPNFRALQKKEHSHKILKYIPYIRSTCVLCSRDNL